MNRIPFNTGWMCRPAASEAEEVPVTIPHDAMQWDLVVGIKNQPATVKAFIRPRTAPDVRLAKLLLQAVNRHFGNVMQMVAA